VGQHSAKVYSDDGKSLVIDTGGNLDARNSKAALPTPKAIAAAGRNGAGAITLTGAAVGDRVHIVIGAPTAGGALVAPAAGTFEAVITVADQVQQASASNLSANTYVFVLTGVLN
jgi:hypothetical protein